MVHIAVRSVLASVVAVTVGVAPAETGPFVSATTAWKVSAPVSVDASRCVTEPGTVQVRVAVDRSAHIETTQLPPAAFTDAVVWFDALVS